MSNNKGFTLVEIIIAVLLLAIAIVPMVGAYGPAIFSTAVEDEVGVFANQARGTLNRVAAIDYAILLNNQGNPVDLVALFGSAAEAAKETFSFHGSSYTPTVAIADVSGGLGGLLEITVTADQVSLITLKTES
jgi:prepilin-type N-terminal cleavage/methylation domain-containing protein